jgi:hypothetical protein
MPNGAVFEGSLPIQGRAFLLLSVKKELGIVP